MLVNIAKYLQNISRNWSLFTSPNATALVQATIISSLRSYNSLLSGFSAYTFVPAHVFPSQLCVLSHSVMSDSLWSYGPARLLCPWGFFRPEYWSGLPCPPLVFLPRWGTSGKEPACQCRRHKRCRVGRSPGGRNGNPLQNSCLQNPMDEEPSRIQSIGL